MENYIIANKTDVGRTRQVNEDSMITFDSPNGRVVAVCDGMGGQAAGDVASQLACSIIRSILEDNTFSTPEEAITSAMMAANQGVLHRAAQEPQLEGMGSTCVMLIIKDGLVHYGWVGDSRIYYISNHTIRQLSHDQSYVQSLVDTGQITPQEAASHPQKNEITNAIGLQGMTPPMLGQAPIRPEQGSVFLLCSDGLSGMVDDAQIERTVSKLTIPLQDRAEQLVALANQHGGIDNITVQMVEFPLGSGVGASNGSSLTDGMPNNRNRNIIYGVAALLVVILLAVAAWLIFGGNEEPKKEPEKAEQTDTRKQNQKADSTNNTQSPASTTKESKKNETNKQKPVRTTTTTGNGSGSKPVTSGGKTGGNKLEKQLSGVGVADGGQAPPVDQTVIDEIKGRDTNPKQDLKP